VKIETAIKTDYDLFNSRFNAHLTFNILNTLQYLILEDEKEEAYRLVNAYSRILRKMLINASNVTSVRSEIDIIIDYLELERIRMDDKFSFLHDVPRSLWEKKIPKSLLISIIENAVKHGMKPLGKKGFIRIDCPDPRKPVIRVKNNSPNGHFPRKSGKGLKLTEALISRHNKAFGTNIIMESRTYIRQSDPGERIFEVLVGL
jgi:LytS/YehU family sensor histidine kinase